MALTPGGCASATFRVYAQVMPTPCFWTEPTGEGSLSLRVYAFGKTDPCPQYAYGHNGWSEPIGREPMRWSDDGYHALIQPSEFAGHPAWPTACDRCGKPVAEWVEPKLQVWQHEVHVRPETGERWPSNKLPPGAMYDGKKPFLDTYVGADGISLVVILPGGGHPWHVDSRATNCTMKDTDPDYTLHKCWVRVGDPKAAPPTVHVSKEGVTCAAGGGSIAAPGYHGFLHHGTLTDG